MSGYNFPEEDYPEFEDSVFEFGNDVGNLRDNEDGRPVVSYKYLSFNGGDMCFNNPKLTLREYTNYFDSIRQISSYSIYDLLESSNKEFRFHSIRPDKIRYLLDDVKDILEITENIRVDDLPVFGQLEVYTDVVDAVGGMAPRVLFFFYRGVLHMMFFDYEHQTYSQSN